MNDKNELNDIILNKGTTANSNKKIILAVATLGVILIIVVMLMNSLSSSGTSNLPQAVLPPEPTKQLPSTATQEPLFEEVDVVQESSSDADLDMIAKKLKQESLEEDLIAEETQEIVEPVVVKKAVVKKEIAKKSVKHVQPSKAIAKSSSASDKTYYIQVGSFSKYAPNKKFLSSISNLGFNYEYHKVGILNKVLVGPFNTSKEAKDARKVLRSKVEPGAFLVKM
ncbi:SPOR domain-containing protein [Sulfurimonas aquatica]|uniref:SPOR domain-containing protein n=1 Tax=Sulfurimonas aquatica TaxID=2672570 RepID=A0A975AZV8_9BACT|nr:SPOR domain-containing protein [Sulfurimonas aquatica]QSZ41560.1 SPOR domain-containing protein [Sulfurimonas aquatica]